MAVYIPEYVVGRWWEQVLHNQTALRLKGRLLFTPGVMVTSVPYQLRGSEKAKHRDDWERRPTAPRRRTTWPDPVGTVTGSEGSLVGERFEVEVGPVAHGGHFVARVSTGLDERQMVIFVRHALPGEQVTVEVTEDERAVPAR